MCRVIPMCAKQIKIAEYLYDELDIKRMVDSEGQKESWTSLICRGFGIKYIPHGLPKKKPVSGRKPKYLAKMPIRFESNSISGPRSPLRTIHRPIFKKVERGR
jgi:hypothetical protein